jgi:hypothetical protein
MEINSIQNYYRMQTAASPANARKAAEETAAAAETRGADKIDISAEASFKAELGKYARTYSAKYGKGASPERIAELKEQYQADACPVSGSDIAAKIVSGILGPGANS